MTDDADDLVRLLREATQRTTVPTATEAEDDAADNVQLLVEVTAGFQHIEYDAPDGTPLAGAALYKAVYSSQPLGFIAEQATRFLSSWANFKPASATN